MNRACFPKEKYQNSQTWAKFMNFSFWPFLWFGLSGRLLTEVRNQGKGGLAKGFLQDPVSLPRDQKIVKDIGLDSTFGTRSATVTRGVFVCKNPLLKPPDLGS